MKQNGFTLVEMLIVISIIAVLVSIGTLSFNKMSMKTNIESEIQQMHSDLMTSRIWAMDRNTCHFVLLNANGSYSVYEDQNGNCIYNTTDALLLSRTATNPVLWNNAAPTGVYLIFDNRGLATVSSGSIPSTISVPDTVNAAYDCILVETTRTSMGRMNGGVCAPK